MTFAAQVIATAGYLLAYRIVAIRSGTVGFAGYALSRRTLALLGPIAFVGLDVGIVRYLSYNASREMGRHNQYVGAAVLLLAIATGVTSLPLLAFVPQSAELFFGSARYVDLLRPLPLLLAGSGLYVIAFGYLRGRLFIGYANLFSVVTQGVIPVLAATIGGRSVPRGLTVLGALWMICSLSVLIFSNSRGVRGIRHDFGQLARFGLTRVPGDLLRFGLLALPAILIAHTSTIDEAGIVAFGVAALGMVATSLAPISLVLLPYAARYLALGDTGALREHVLSLTKKATVVLVLIVLVLEILTPEILRLYLGPTFVSGAGLLRLMMLGAVPWGLYMILRSVVDAYHERPVNGINTAIAFGCFVVLAAASRFVMPSSAGITLALVGSLYVLGILTVIETIRVLRMPVPLARVRTDESASIQL